MSLKNILVAGTFFLCSSESAIGACGGTSITWSAAFTNAWGTAGNWTPANIPDLASENAIIVSASRPTSVNGNYTVGCVNVQSGELRSANNKTLTIKGDYFRALTLNTLNISSNSFFIDMAGTGPQTFEVVDPIANLTVSNNSTVTLTQPFSIWTSFVISGTTSIVYVDASLSLDSGIADVTVPTGTTLRLRSGATLTVNANLTVNGTLILDDGTSLIMANGKTLSVGSAGVIQLNGADGNIAQIDSLSGANSYTFNMAGLMIANYFRISRTTTNGLNVTGNIQSLNYGEFHYLANAGRAITLQAGSAIASTMSDLAFYDDSGYGNVKNINADAYTGSVATINNWAGGVGGPTYETDAGNKITWGAQANTNLVLTNSTASGSPPTTLGQNSADTLFATFGFSLNQASTMTNITSVTISMIGSAQSSDTKYVKLYRDDSSSRNCVYNAGTDVQIGGSEILSGSPPKVTFAITPGDVQTDSSSNIYCIHVISATSAAAQDAATLEFAISSTSDVTNSQSYSFSPSSGPPVSAGFTTIIGSPVKNWQGDKSALWSIGGNWNSIGAPTSATDCNVGIGVTVATIDAAAVQCQNSTFQSGGAINFNGANTFSSYAGMTVQSGYIYSNASTGQIAMRGTSNQNLNMSTDFPGKLLIANTGTSPSNIVTVSNSTKVVGDVTVTSGVLSIPNGVTFTVGGNITVQTGATLEILPGGTLALANNKILTVDTGGIFKAIGTASLTSTVTSELPTSAYSVVVNGQIHAQYYAFRYLNVNGVSIESGATVNATNHLQDGNFYYPVNSNTTFLKLKTQVPGNTLSNISFSSGGSVATNVKNIDTTVAAAGTLSVTAYTGDLAGASYDVDPAYLISWSGATNTIDITQEATGPANVDAGSTYNMGRYGFRQTLAGASYSSVDLTSLKINLSGTGSSSDISTINLYKDTDCDGASGTLIGTNSFSGSPPSVTFVFAGGTFTIAADVASPPKNCIYVEYAISNGASNAKTVGVSITSGSDMATDLGYMASGSISFPLTLGSPAVIAAGTNTLWTGTTNTNWFTASNWTSGVPTSTKNCTINNVANDPIINGASGTAICKNVSIGDGILTFTNATSALLEVYGTLTSTGTITQSDGVIRFFDGGTGASQSLSTSGNLTAVEILKSGGGTVTLSGTNTTISSLTFNSGNTGRLLIPSGKTLVLTNGVSIPNGTLEVAGGGVLKIGNTKTITVNGGTLKTSGTHDSYPQDPATKGKITVNTSGTWGITATSGTVSLTGFLLDYLNTSGLNVGGTTDFTTFSGGQFTNLPTAYSTMRVMQINTASVASAPSDIEWYWGPNNSPPSSSDTYQLANSTGCGSNTITFNNWWGDFFDPVLLTPDPSTKISQTNCNVVISYSNSPVSLLSFIATGYDSAVALEWVTGSETNHNGFNVYRSFNSSDHFVQINHELVRNNYSGLGPQGYYYFEDTTAVNGALYYYMIEDVSTAGVKVRHGPIAAIPVGGLGSPPGPGTNENSSDTNGNADNGNSPGSGPITNPGLIDLGHGIHILSQTAQSMKLEVIPPPYTLNVSTWNGAYQEVEMPGYTKTLDVGSPELVQKTILIEVLDPNATSVEVSNSSVITNPDDGSHLIQPAPEWNLDSGSNLIPTYSPSASVYSQNNLSPNDHYSIESQLVEVSGKKYIELTIQPLRYNPVSQIISALQKLTLDIGIGGSAWSEPNPTPTLAESPAAVPGVIRAQYDKTGMYEIGYDDMEFLGIEGNFKNLPTINLRVYLRNKEIPIQVISVDSLFNTGDKIRFYAEYYSTRDSIYNEMVISPIPLGVGSNPPLRILSLDASPSGRPVTSMPWTESKVDIEEDQIFLNDRPMGDLTDHFYWKRLGKWNSSKVSYYSDKFSFPISLPGLIRSNSLNVILGYEVRGRTQISQNATNHFGVFINSSSVTNDDLIFNNYGPVLLTSFIKSSNFIDGDNIIKIQVLPDLVPVNDWALLDINRLSAVYPSDFNAYLNSKDIFKPYLDEAITVRSFTSNQVSIYDVSENSDVRVLANVNVTTPNAGTTYDATFAFPSVSDEHLGYHLLAIDDSAVLKPTSMFLNTGFSQSLHSSQNQADFIIIGSRELLSAAAPLIQKRATEGLHVKAIEQSQIYAEFSYGIPSSDGIRNFITYTQNSWTSPKPKYLLFLGDGTIDPKDRYGNSPESELTPIPFLSGDFADFGSDSWFATAATEWVPKLSVGRIPAVTPLEVSDFVNKILKYEGGDFSPDQISAKQHGFFADSDTLYEGFSKKSDGLAKLVKSSNKSASTWSDKLDNYATTGDFKTAILSRFDDPPLTMTFVGHGSEDMWAEYVVEATDVTALNNTRLPIVLGLNCSSGYFYDADTNVKGLGEAYIMNPSGGAIAYWGSTTYTSPETQTKLATAFFENLALKTAGPYKVVRIGDVTLIAQKTLANQSTAKDVVRSWVLLGDPTMKLPANAFAETTNSEKSNGGGCGRLQSTGNGSGTGIIFLLLLIPLFCLASLRKSGLKLPHHAVDKPK